MRPPRGHDLDEQLRGEERAARLDRHGLERLAAEELAGAVGVADPQPEERPQAEAVDPRVGESHRGVGAPDPIADDDVRLGSRPAGR